MNATSNKSKQQKGDGRVLDCKMMMNWIYSFSLPLPNHIGWNGRIYTYICIYLSTYLYLSICTYASAYISDICIYHQSIHLCHLYLIPVQFSSVAQPCPTLWDPMDCSTSGFPVHHQLLELTQTHVHLSQWYHPTIPSFVAPFSSHLQSFPASGSFKMSQFFTSGGQRIGVSASALLLSMNIQDWFPLGWTGWIPLQSKGLSSVFLNTTVQKHQVFGAQLSL